MIKNSKIFFYILYKNTKEYFIKGKLWAVFEQIVAIFRALMLVLEIVISKNLFDYVTNKENFNKIMISLILLLITIIFKQLLDGLGQYLLSKVSYTNMGKFMVDFQKKLSNLPAIYFENKDFLDKIEKAKECLEYESLGHFASTSIQLFTYYLVYFIAIDSYLFKSSPLLSIILILGFLPSVINQIIKAKYFIELEEILAPYRRKANSYKNSITHIKYYKETRMLGAFNYFYNLFSETLELIAIKKWKIEKKIFLIQLSVNFVTFIGFGLSIYILFLQMTNNLISIGMFVAIFISLSDVFSIMEELIDTYLGNSSEIFGQVLNFYTLMELENDVRNSNNLDFSNGIDINNIDFKYLKQNEYAISNLSLKIYPNETIAIVGENGSRKSTLAKLITGIYSPSKGNIYVNNENIYGNYMNTSAVFQNFQKYKFTLKDNVSISDVKQKDNYIKINNCLKKSKVKYNEKMYNTVLAPEFGGIDLSGGNWQRLAIARSLFKESKIIILDEPTSNIDPIEESKLYSQFEEIVKDKISFIITHRLGSVKFADKIIVMEKGKIIEIGNHEELIGKNGKYKSMWESQKKWYNR